MSFPRVAVYQPTQKESDRKHADGINYLLGRIDLLESLIVEMVISAYGSVIQEATISNFNIGAGWTTLPFDTLTTSPRGISFNTTNNTFQFENAGAWRISTGFNLSGHNSSNQGRTTNIRLWNVADSAEAGRISIGIGRNVEDTQINVSNIWNITEDNLNEEYRFEVGGGSSVTGGDLTNHSIAANYLDRLSSLGQ